MTIDKAAIAERALGMILDDPSIDAYLTAQAQVKTGRMSPIEDDDPDWWQAKTDALNGLLDEAKRLNNVSAE